MILHDSVWVLTGQIYDNRPRLASCDLQGELREFCLRQINFASYEESTGGPVRGLNYYILLFLFQSYTIRLIIWNLIV